MKFVKNNKKLGDSNAESAEISAEKTKRRRSSELRSDAQGGALCHWVTCVNSGGRVKRVCLRYHLDKGSALRESKCLYCCCCW